MGRGPCSTGTRSGRSVGPGRSCRIDRLSCRNRGQFDCKGRSSRRTVRSNRKCSSLGPCHNDYRRSCRTDRRSTGRMRCRTAAGSNDETHGTRLGTAGSPNRPHHKRRPVRSHNPRCSRNLVRNSQDHNRSPDRRHNRVRSRIPGRSHIGRRNLGQFRKATGNIHHVHNSIHCFGIRRRRARPQPAWQACDSSVFPPKEPGSRAREETRDRARGKVGKTGIGGTIGRIQKIVSPRCARGFVADFSFPPRSHLLQTATGNWAGLHSRPLPGRTPS